MEFYIELGRIIYGFLHWAGTDYIWIMFRLSYDDSIWILFRFYIDV